jgi:NTP pyrophosphatase (non-canonical NTP hydrolase)
MDLQSQVSGFYMLMAGRPPNSREALEYFEEEVDELLEALDEWFLAVQNGAPTKPDLIAHVAKEIGDVAFCLVAIAEAVGVDYEEAADIVAEDNLQNKLPTRRGKVRKKQGYSPPSMKGAIL